METRLLLGYLENPGRDSFQSGVGVISGWVCEADEVEITLGTLTPQRAAYGTERLDTASDCGDTDNGFGLLFNWNLLGDGEHEVVARVDGVELGRAMVTVTTFGEEFLRGAEGECIAEDFPHAGGECARSVAAEPAELRRGGGAAVGGDSVRAGGRADGVLGESGTIQLSERHRRYLGLGV